MDIKITIKAELDESTSTSQELTWMLNFLHLKHLESRTTLIDGRYAGYTEFELDAVVNGSALLDFLQRDDSYYLNVPEVK